MTTNAKAFLDTNILLRATITQFPLHEQAKALVDEQLDVGVDLWISRQVIREFIAQVTRPQSFMHPMTIDQVEQRVQTMQLLFQIADDTSQVTQQLLALLKAYPTGGKQVHDANIVATMLVFGIPTLLTANVDDVHRFADRITIVPLVTNS